MSGPFDPDPRIPTGWLEAHRTSEPERRYPIVGFAIVLLSALAVLGVIAAVVVMVTR